MINNYNEADAVFMAQALQLAQQAYKNGETPVGAVVVYQNRVIGKGSNNRELARSALGHAELIAIAEASANISAWRLLDCSLYVTLEPCIMCAGAILQARIPRVIFGARDPKGGAVNSLYSLLADTRLNHQCEVTEGVCADECSDLLKTFFRELRLAKKSIE